jgi:hypothetical protein
MILRTVTARDGTTLVPLEGDELAGLIKTGNVIPARFGTGGTALIAKDCPWALPLLAEWRGIAFTDGAGI